MNNHFVACGKADLRFIDNYVASSQTKLSACKGFISLSRHT